MDLKKRTDDQISAAEDNNDDTGGYGFVAWLIYMRLKYVFLETALMFFGTWIALLTTDPIGIGAGILFAAGGLFGAFLTVREYKKLKKGQSS
jgi:hypothetical protein